MTTNIYEDIGEHITSGGPVINVDPTTGWDQDDPRFNAKYAGLWDWPFRTVGTRSDNNIGAIAHITNGGGQKRASVVIVVRNGAGMSAALSSDGPPPVFSAMQLTKARILYQKAAIELPYGVSLHLGLPDPSTGVGGVLTGASPVMVVNDVGFPNDTALIKTSRNAGVIGGCVVNRAPGGIGVEIGAPFSFAHRTLAYGCAIGYMAQTNGVDGAGLDHAAAINCVDGVKLQDNLTPGNNPNHFGIHGGSYSQNTHANIWLTTSGAAGRGGNGCVIDGDIRLHNNSGYALLNQGYDNVIFGPNPYMETDVTLTTVPRVSWQYATAAGLLAWRGAWSGATAYIVGDGVVSGGARYVCVLANTNQAPPNATYWRPVDAYAPHGGAILFPDFHSNIPTTFTAEQGFHLDVSAAYRLLIRSFHRGIASDPTRPAIYLHEGAIACETHIGAAYDAAGVPQTTLANLYKSVGTGNWGDYVDSTGVLKTFGTVPSP